MNSLCFCAAPLSARPARTLPHSLTTTRPLHSQPSPSRRSLIVAADKSLALPAKLDKLVDSFAAVPDAKMRYQQLIFFAKKLPDMDDSLKTEANRVRGCTSVVFVDVTLDDEGLVHIAADSDAQLTKGLVALLVNGLSGCSLDEVLAVDPAFINASGLSVSLTPSRNNGFVNMVAKIKEKLVLLREAGGGEGAVEVAEEDDPDFHYGRPIYSAMLKQLRLLKLESLELKDLSHLHAGHSGAAKGESHFALKVSGDCFEGMALVKRHQLIFELFSAVMPDTHSITISAHTPEELKIKAEKRAAARAAK